MSKNEHRERILFGLNKNFVPERLAQLATALEGNYYIGKGNFCCWANMNVSRSIWLLKPQRVNRPIPRDIMRKGEIARKFTELGMD